MFRFFSLGGVEAVLHNRKKALKRQGVNVDILFLTRRTKGLFDNDSNVFFISNTRSIKVFLTQRHYELISIIDSPDFFAILHAVAYDGIVINECHTSQEEHLEYVQIISRLPVVKTIISPSTYWSEWIHRKYMCPIPIYTVPNGIDLQSFAHQQAQPKNFKLPNPLNKPILCWIGRMDQIKNPWEFLKIVKEIKTTTSHFTAWMIDGGTYSPLMEEIRLGIIKTGLSNYVHIKTKVPYKFMPLVYSQVANSGGCLISTSRTECYPMTFLEAMVSRCPIICSYLQETKEIVRNNISGLCYDLTNTTEAVLCILKILNQTELRRAITNYAYEQTSRLNDNNTIAGTLKAIYSKL